MESFIHKIAFLLLSQLICIEHYYIEAERKRHTHTYAKIKEYTTKNEQWEHVPRDLKQLSFWVSFSAFFSLHSIVRSLSISFCIVVCLFVLFHHHHRHATSHLDNENSNCAKERGKRKKEKNSGSLKKPPPTITSFIRLISGHSLFQWW